MQGGEHDLRLSSTGATSAVAAIASSVSPHRAASPSASSATVPSAVAARAPSPPGSTPKDATLRAAVDTTSGAAVAPFIAFAQPTAAAAS